MNKLAYFLVIAGGFAVLYSVGRAWKIKPETKSDHSLTIGEMAVVKGAEGSQVWLAVNERDGYDVNVAMAKKDSDRLKRYEDAKTAFPVAAGTLVKVRAERASRLKVEVLDGAHSGREGWAEFEYFRPGKAGDKP